MISISKIYPARYCEPAFAKPQILWLALWSFLVRIAAGFLRLGIWSVLHVRIVRQSPACPCLPYRSNFLGKFPKSGDQGLRKVDYRIDAEPTVHQVSAQTPSRKKHGVRYTAYLLLRTFHIYFWKHRPSIASTLFHCKKLLSFACQLFPKTVQYLSRYTAVAFQTSSLICQAPVVPATRGTLLQ